MLGDAIRHEGALSPTVLSSWKEVIGDWARARGLCGVCETAALERDVKARRKVWDSLPRIFDIEVEGWVAGGGDGWEAERLLNHRLKHDGGVIMSTGEAYGEREPGHFRLVHCMDESLLREGIKRYKVKTFKHK